MGSTVTRCAPGQTCTLPFEVSCPHVRAAARGNLVVVGPTGSPRGVVVILLGGLAQGFEGVNRQFVSSLSSDGFEVVVLSWVDSWLQSSPGEQVGPKRLACRAATAVRWTYDHLYQALGAPREGLGGCGFCLHGNSGGASQTAYALSFYGLDDIVDAAIMSGGPPHAGLAAGCLQQDGYTFDTNSAHIIDLSYGFPNGNGPCERHDATYRSHWDQDSVDVGGVYKYPRARIAFVFVSGDPTVGPQHGMLYEAKLKKAKTPYLSVKDIAGNKHTIESLPNGRATLESELLAKS